MIEFIAAKPEFRRNLFCHGLLTPVFCFLNSTSAKKHKQSDSASLSLLFAKAFGKTQQDFTLGDLCPSPQPSPPQGGRSCEKIQIWTGKTLLVVLGLEKFVRLRRTKIGGGREDSHR